jgi:hypothetical protein
VGSMIFLTDPARAQAISRDPFQRKAASLKLSSQARDELCCNNMLRTGLSEAAPLSYFLD